MKLTKKEKEELSNSFNISLPTFYNWEKNKPRLIELILLGLQKERELLENIEDAEKLYPMIQKLQKELEEIREEIRK